MWPRDRLCAFLSSSRFHLWMMVVWTLLILPTLLWWRDSVFWVVLMSLYAIVVSHWGAFQAARAEEKADESTPAE